MNPILFTLWPPLAWGKPCTLLHKVSPQGGEWLVDPHEGGFPPPLPPLVPMYEVQ